MFHMRLHRFYITEKIVGREEITLSDSELVHQLVNVFRLRVGDEIIIFDGTGVEAVSQIVSVNKKELVVKILRSENKNPETEKKNVSLFLALIKKGNFELAVEKCTEVGVAKIFPVLSERSEKKDLNMERVNKITKEASEQSGRVILPEVFEPIGLEEAIVLAKKENKRCVVFHTDHHGSQTRHSSLEKEEIDGGCAAFIGPEGGWTEKELELFRANNFEFLSLGQTILRAETAAIVASALLLRL